MYDEKKLYILEEDWKNLIILDACRYDYFKDLCLIPGNLEKRITLADCTINFVNRNFKDRNCQDIIYFNAIPTANYKNYIEGIDIWNVEGATNNPFRVILPNYFRQQIEASISSYSPQKRFIFHFLQPHFPFVFEPQNSPLVKEDIIFDATHCIKYGKKYGWDKIKLAYEENLKGVLKEVIILISRLYAGKTVITSDHGELLGKDDKYGHGSGQVEIKPEYNEIWQVPWFIVDRNGSERVKEQLKALAYL